MGRRERAAKAFLLLASAACWIMGGAPAAAQVVLDGTLGPSGPLPGPDVTIPAAVGTQAGPNLFHSFATFSIPQGESATFTGPAGLNNVISRVTGGEVSTIDGVLRSRIENADFWFLNPAGVVFGPNAELDVPASFHLSTADELRFADGERFRATTPGDTVLTVARPEAFGFLRANPAKIEVNESRLETKPGQVLSLVGGDISIKGGNVGEIRAEGGQINLSSLAGPGEVAIPDGTPSGAAGGAITLEDQAWLDASGNGGGTVRIRGGQFVLQGSAVHAGNEGGLDATGGIDVQADKVDMREDSLLTANAFGAGDAGDIALTVGRLELRDGAQVVAVTYGPGDAGSLTVMADEIVATGVSEGFPSGLFTNSDSESVDAGKGGDIALDVGRLELSSGGVVAATTSGPGDAGSLTVMADEIVATGGSGLSASSESESVDAGKGGDIALDVGRLELSGGGVVSAVTYGPGDAGSLTVMADEIVATGVSEGSPSGLFASSQSESVDAGKGGDIALDVGRLELSGGSQVGAGTFGPGDPGSLTVIADEVVATGMSGDFHSGLFASSHGEGADAGKGGNITLDVGRLELSSGGMVSAGTFGPGDGGSLTVIADEVVAIGRSGDVPSGLFASSQGEGADAGKGGDIALDVGRLELHDGAGVAAVTFGPGDAGGITLTVDRLELSGGSQVHTTTFGPGDAGSLMVTANEVVATGVSGGFPSGLFASSESESVDAGKGGDIALDVGRLELHDGVITARTSGPGDAGSLTVMADEIVATGGSGLFASSESESVDAGKGGDIALTVGRLELSAGSQVQAGTFGPGDGGNLTVNADEVVATGIDSGLFASSVSEEPGAGKSGMLTITAPTITLSDGAAFATSREGGVVGDSPDPDAEGPLLQPGSIDVEADVLRMSNNASITAETARVDAGDIVIEVEELIDLEDSAITTSAADGAGAGGNIDIDPRFLVLDRSRIIANAREGAGGNIDIAADFIFRSPDSVIEASSDFGISGTVDIAATDVDVTSGVVALPAAFLNPAALRARCGGRPTGGTGTFTGIGRGGTGLTPDAPLPGVYSDLIEPTGSAATSAALAAPPPVGNDTPVFAGSAWLTSCYTE